MSLRNLFDLDPNLIYLNSGTHSFCPRPVFDAVTRYQREYERNPTAGLIGVWARLWKAQCALAKFFSGDPRDFYFRPNITAALNDFIQGVPLPTKSEIVHTELEYGAIVNACRMRAERDGLTLRSCALPSWPQNPEDIVDAIMSEVSPRTSMLLASHVMTGTGLIVPIRSLARKTRERGILLVVDGAHAPGALDLRFDELQDVDFYGGNLHKWMMGPKGTAFGWVAKRHHDSLVRFAGGWSTYEKPAYHQDFGGGCHFTERFALLGCHDFAPFLALSDIIDFWKTHGRESIQQRRHALLEKLRDHMLAANPQWKCLSPATPSLQGPLVSFDLRDDLQRDAPSLMQAFLNEHRLQISVTTIRTRFALRLSPHIYNTEDEFAQAARLLAPFA